VLGVDERRDAAGGLRVGDRVQRDSGFTGGFRTVDPSATSRAIEPVGMTEIGWRISSPSRITEPLP
jgi:hypothetical protein